MSKVVDQLIKKFEHRPSEYEPTGSVVLDLVLSDGKGAPKGKFIEVYSDSGYGKTTLLLAVARYFCSKGKTVLYLDIEKGVNQSQIDGIGLAPYVGKQFIRLEPSTFEDVEEIWDELVVGKVSKEGKHLSGPTVRIDHIMADSITSLSTTSLLSRSITDIMPGEQARMVSSLYQKYKTYFNRAGITCWFINQTRTKFNFRGISSRGAAGGNAQEFYMDIRLELSGKKTITSTKKTVDGAKEVVYGAHVGLSAVKNRHAPPFISVPLTIIYGKGVSNIAFYQKFLQEKGFIELSSNGWYTFKFNGKEEKCRGELALNQFIKENLPAIKTYIESIGGLRLVEEE